MATASERPSVGDLGRARDKSLRACSEAFRLALLYRFIDEPRQPKYPELRPNQRLNEPLGSPPSVAVGYCRRAPPTEAARPYQNSIGDDVAAAVEISRFFLPKRTDGLCSLMSTAVVASESNKLTPQMPDRSDLLRE